MEEVSLQETEHFAFADTYNGRLIDDEQPEYRTRMYGIDSYQTHDRSLNYENDLWSSSTFGFVVSGALQILCEATKRISTVRSQEFFSLPQGGKFTPIEPDFQRTRAIIIRPEQYRGYRLQGGPLEELGRMKYIDKCSDTLLCSPLLKGDPCFNHLHFPKGINQTHHTHPSTRMGMVAYGRGFCTTPDGKYELFPGRIFYIPKDGMHGFNTEHNNVMGVVAYHPDSDFGPVHEDHPMVNRTWVDGTKIDNTHGDHVKAEIVQGRLK